jgi:Fungal specific transcription factor domain
MSIDGNVSPNFYNDYWVPWSIKSPLLANLSILTAANFQAEAQKIPSGKSTVALHYKVKSIGLLNEMLGNRESAISTEAIAAVVSLLANEWFWLHRAAVKRHLAGLKMMIKLRGGLDELRMNGFPRKLVLQ